MLSFMALQEAGRQ